jgi:hypothetical protein
LIEEQENKSKLFRTRNLDVEVERTQEDSQKTEAPTPDREEVFPLNPRKESQQREVTMPRGDKNQNGKRNTEMKLTGKQARKLSKKRSKIEKLQKVPEGTSQKENLQIGTSSGYQNNVTWHFTMVKKYSHWE